MKINRKLLDRTMSVVLFLPLLLPRITISTGYESVIYGATFFFLFLGQLRSLKLSRESIISLLSAMGCLLLAMVGSLVQDYTIDYRVLLFALTLLLFAVQRPDEDLAHGLYGFAVVSVLVAVPMSFTPSLGFIVPASTYQVFGLERITFFFYEPSHYSIVLALSFGVGMLLKKPRWMQLVLLAGISMTFSVSGMIILVAVYLVNQNRNRGTLKAIFYGATLVGIGALIFVRFLTQIDSSGVIATRMDQIVTGVTVGFNYSSTGVRIASVLAGMDFLSEALLRADFSSFLLGIGFEGVQGFVSRYYNAFFIEQVDNEMIFNFLSAAIISGGFLGFLLYLGALDNIRSSNKISLSKWLFLISCLSLTHGYLYGPLAFIFVLYGGLSISNLSYRQRRDVLPIQSRTEEVGVECAR